MKLISVARAAETGSAKLGQNLITQSGWFSSGKIDWGKLISQITSTLFFSAALASLIFLIWGGIGIILSGGDKGKLDAARNRMIFAAVGLIVVACSYALWRLVLTFVGISSLESGI